MHRLWQGYFFLRYARKHIDKLISRGQERTSRNYKWALQHMERFAETDNIMFSRMTSAFLNRWIESLSETSRCKEQYPVCIREVYKPALKEFNDEELGINKIKNPWGNVVIPRSDIPEKRAIPASMLRKFFNVVPDRSRFTNPLMEVGQDVALISFCMCGLNAVDIFNAKKEQYVNGIFHYERQKTRMSRPLWKQLMIALERGDELVISKYSNAIRRARELAMFLEFCQVKVIRVISIHDYQHS
ncbi:Uncharacterised protein [Prevotella intermedia]|nr:Uncharacterised protein [Prevotella intermedia]